MEAVAVVVIGVVLVFSLVFGDGIDNSERIEVNCQHPTDHLHTEHELEEEN